MYVERDNEHLTRALLFPPLELLSLSRVSAQPYTFAQHPLANCQAVQLPDPATQYRPSVPVLSPICDTSSWVSKVHRVSHSDGSAHSFIIRTRGRGSTQHPRSDWRLFVLKRAEGDCHLLVDCGRAGRGRLRQDYSEMRACETERRGVGACKRQEGGRATGDAMSECAR